MKLRAIQVSLLLALFGFWHVMTQPGLIPPMLGTRLRDGLAKTYAWIHDQILSGSTKQ